MCDDDRERVQSPAMDECTDYEYAEQDAWFEAQGEDLLPTRAPTLDVLAEYLGVDERYLVIACVASTARAGDTDEDLARGVAEELRTMADDIEARLEEAADE